MIRSLIIENEPSNYAYLKAMLDKHFPDIELLEVCVNIPDAISAVKAQDPDLIFLDIELPPFTGFNLLEETRGMKYHTIFTTSFNQYAVKAFKFAAVHYLQKPYGLDDLQEAIELYKKRVGAMVADRPIDTLLYNLKEKEAKNQVIGIPVLGGHEFIKIKDIVCCQAQNNYTEIRMSAGNKVMVTKTLSWVEQALIDHPFFRVHKSYLIPFAHIVKYMRGDGGIVMLSDGYEVDVARNKKDAFVQKMREMGMM